MQSLWAHRAFPEEFKVLNLRLQPYSCGHEITLAQIGSPFLTGQLPTPEDLSVACLICSQPFKSGQELVRGGNLKVSKAWSTSIQSLDFGTELKAFDAYLEAGTWSPPTVAQAPSKNVSVRTMKAPRVYRLIPFLCSRLGLTEADALDFPMARAHAYFAAEMDRRGEIKLNADDTDAVEQFLAEQDAAEARGENPWGT